MDTGSMILTKIGFG